MTDEYNPGPTNQDSQKTRGESNPPTQKESPSDNTLLTKRFRKVRKPSIAAGLVSWSLAVAISLTSTIGPLKDFKDDLIGRVTDNIVAGDMLKGSKPLSQSLNLEGMLADAVDNTVVITHRYGMGCGTFLDPYHIGTVNHVIEDAIKEHAPIYIECPSRLGPGKCIKVMLTQDNVLYNEKLDRAVIYLPRPVYAAKKLDVLTGKAYRSQLQHDNNIVTVGYRFGTVYHQLGAVEQLVSADVSGGSIQVSQGETHGLTNINSIPGNSGSGVYTPDGRVLGWVSFITTKGKEASGPMFYVSANAPVFKNGATANMP